MSGDTRMSTKKIHKILVANRGEIAVRVLRTAKGLGYRTVAVHSEADAEAPHVAMADGAVCIGPAPVGESYLDAEKILDAARGSGADAVHPGYGFLSENTDFARACEAAGITFIGPTPEAVELMGNKAAAKRRMIEAGVPCVPGYEGEDQSDEVFVRAAEEIGYPVMVKAAAGGGGRGMRLVEAADGLERALSRARSEAKRSFGSEELILEKAIARPRHVEVQVFADVHGNVIHLGERDCSVQRRHQKVIEEAPCPILTPERRAEMGAAAVEAARNIGYRGAGTVEFLLAPDGAFYFLEMNTRLQVEHPVTEMITGLDLVALQIRVAEGEPLPLGQDDVTLDGHAIEVRLYAENPDKGFLPDTGPIDLWLPPEGEGVRVDAGVATGLEVSPFYDSMQAKIIAWGETRDVARRRLIGALRNAALFGPATNREFLAVALSNDTFAAGEATTAFLEEEAVNVAAARTTSGLDRAAVAAVLQYRAEARTALEASVGVAPELAGWSSSGAVVTRYVYELEDETVLDLTVAPHGLDQLRVQCGEEIRVVWVTREDGAAVDLEIDGTRRRALFVMPERGRIHLSLDGEELAVENRLASAAVEGEGEADGTLVAPMHGMLLEILVAVGDSVSKGDRLGVLEAMKMQHELLATVDGVVSEIIAKAGQQIAAGDRVLEIEVAEES